MARKNSLQRSRRVFIAQCSSLATVLACAPCFGAGIAPYYRRKLSLDQLSYFHFASLVGSHFDVIQGLLKTRLQLVAATSHEDDAAEHPVDTSVEPEQFSLLFRGPQHHVLDQNSHVFTHPRLGNFTMFIVPVGRTEELSAARFYEAVFNRPAVLDATL